MIAATSWDNRDNLTPPDRGEEEEILRCEYCGGPVEEGSYHKECREHERQIEMEGRHD